MGRLDGKAALVLGAAGRKNMGQAVARAFAHEGAKVMVAGRREEPLREIAAEIGGRFALCDITVESDISGLISAACDAFGRIDIGVNATGWGLLKPFLHTTREELEKITAVQFIGPYQFMQALIPAMTEGGSIIQISSATATIMLDNHAAYMGTKAGIDHVVRCIANEFGQHGIRANSISPGFTVSPMTKGAANSPALLKTFAEAYPMGRIGTVDDIAEAAVWLASDACFMTGQNLQVNGGLTLRRNPRAHEIQAAMASDLAAR